MKYKLVVCGGTFDYLHEGHISFLRFVFSLGEKVILGLTTDFFIEKSNKRKISSFEIRKKSLEDFLQRENFLDRSEIIPIDDIYGTTLNNKLPIEAIIVTHETKKGAEEINEKRKKLGLPMLSVEIMEMVKKSGFIISSSLIRKGLIDDKGELFVLPEYFLKTYILPTNLRETLHEPFGEILADGIEEIKMLDPDKIAVVGDVGSKKFNSNNIGQKISIIDFTVERKKSFASLKELGFSGEEKVIYAENPAGKISPSVWESISDLTKDMDLKRFVIVINGEEDLVFIPLLLSLPLGFSLFYGQPHVGLVRVNVTLENKKRMRDIFREFL